MQCTLNYDKIKDGWANEKKKNKNTFRLFLDRRSGAACDGFNSVKDCSRVPGGAQSVCRRTEANINYDARIAYTRKRAAFGRGERTELINSENPPPPPPPPPQPTTLMAANPK